MSDVTVTHRLFPRCADETALLRIEDSAHAAVASIATAYSGRRYSRHSRSGLKHKGKNKRIENLLKLVNVKRK